MKSREISGILMIIMIVNVSLVLGIRPVKAVGTIYIRPDGSVDPPTAPINRDGDLYTFTDNIHTDSGPNSIVVERNNILLDGSGHSLLGGMGWERGILLSSRDNVTIRNMVIESFGWGIYLFSSSNITVSGNVFVSNFNGTLLDWSDHNEVTQNAFVSNIDVGIAFYAGSDYNNIANNNFTDNFVGVFSYAIAPCTYNSIVGNNITQNDFGVYFVRGSQNAVVGNNVVSNNIGLLIEWSYDNQIYHNNFVDNSQQASATQSGYANVWDDGYPSGGNYWSDYVGSDLNGDYIGDTPYIINEDNQDSYPLMNKWFLGDVNHDGIVDIFDIGVISAHWYPGPPIGPLGYNSVADLNNDGAIDIFDIGIVSAHWGESW